VDRPGDVAAPLGGEAGIHQAIDLKARLIRVYCPAARIPEVQARLKSILGHDRFQVLAIEGLDALPSSGVVGATRALTAEHLLWLDAEFKKAQSKYLGNTQRAKKWKNR
jgi:hypothetical protein